GSTGATAQRRAGGHRPPDGQEPGDGGAFHSLDRGIPGRGNRILEQVLVHDQQGREPVQRDLKAGISFRVGHGSSLSAATPFDFYRSYVSMYLPTRNAHAPPQTRRGPQDRHRR